MLGARCQEHMTENKQKELAMFNLEQGRSGRANQFPVIKYLKDCGDAKGKDLFPGAPEESMATKGWQIQGERFR